METLASRAMRSGPNLGPIRVLGALPVYLTRSSPSTRLGN
jgi:hypothetical protein